jgi:hypothetical protein
VFGLSVDANASGRCFEQQTFIEFNWRRGSMLCYNWTAECQTVERRDRDDVTSVNHADQIVSLERVFQGIQRLVNWVIEFDSLPVLQIFAFS